MKYTHLVIDAMNFVHHFLDEQNEKKVINNKLIYSRTLADSIEGLQSLEERFLSGSDTDKVYLLFDNSDSRIDLSNSFYNAPSRKDVFPDYKVHRKKKNLYLYNTLDLLKYYYIINTKKYQCVQIPNLEADDLVKPALTHIFNEFPQAQVLLVSSDSDWARYLSDKVHILCKFKESPKSNLEYEQELGFPLMEHTLVLYKSLFGDSADNIPKIYPKSEKVFDYFLDYCKKGISDWKNLSSNKFIARVCLDAQTRSHPLFSDSDLLNILDTQKLRINLQLSSAIPVNPQKFLAYICRGRDSPRIRSSIESAIGIKKLGQFEFGFF